jgi:thioredoxin-related protein
MIIMMKNNKNNVGIVIVSILVLGLFVLGACDSAQQSGTAEAAEGQFEWYHSWDEGMAAAKESNKPVIVDFTADWCIWCKRMDEDTFSQEKVRNVLHENFVGIKLDVEADQEGTYYLKEEERLAAGYIEGDMEGFEENTSSNQQIATVFGASGLPTFGFFDTEGRYIGPISGYKEADEFTIILQYVADAEYKNDVTLQDYLEANR